MKFSPAIQVFNDSQKDKSYVSATYKMCEWFAGDEAFESVPEYSLNKGLYIMGESGCGKTTVINALHDISRELKLPTSFRIITSREISSKYKSKGDEALRLYTDKSFSTLPNTRYSQPDYTKPVTWCLDDFGLELEYINGKYELPAHYANKSNVMAEIILDRYNSFVRHKMITHLTTNIKDGNIVEDMYGIQVRSRMRQMFNQIEFNSPDKRV